MSLSESRPTFGAIYKSGRGGAGNFHHMPSATALAQSTSNMTIAPKPHAFFSGRGGAANAHPAAERAMFSFDEEIQHASRANQAPVYSIGRGGAGNIVPAQQRRGSSHSNGSSVQEEDAAPRSSMSSAESIRQKIRNSIHRH